MIAKISPKISQFVLPVIFLFGFCFQAKADRTYKVIKKHHFVGLLNQLVLHFGHDAKKFDVLRKMTEGETHGVYGYDSDDRLISLTGDRDPRVRVAVVYAAGIMEGEGLKHTLYGLAKDPALVVRTALATIARDIGGERGLNILDSIDQKWGSSYERYEIRESIAFAARDIANHSDNVIYIKERALAMYHRLINGENQQSPGRNRSCLSAVRGV